MEIAVWEINFDTIMNKPSNHKTC